ncbi:two-component system sensor histidine kinase PhoQ [Marinimicrobium koreense]|uniref:histidine kinase n=1 Tax=Marinimicrobium koreense TaxID=306545 RepID=A0A3N1NMM4_9GAMM|nr:ATP-binding protein [Marinimicrobium koreense]ROQ21034.1 two-component system sensor histidine kinase PhoQ [Marinimicrobium koreense]
MSQRPLSLNARLLLASLLVLPLFLGLTGLVLERAFDRSLTTAAREQLQGQIYLLFSVAEMQGTGEQAQLEMPPALLEPNFERLNSGLYGYLSTRAGRTVWHSNSAQLRPELPSTGEFPQPGDLLLDQIELDGQPHWRARYAVIWEDDAGQDHDYLVTLLRDQTPYRAELASFRRQLWRWLGAAALLLVIAQSASLRWGLRPLGRLARALDAMREGSRPHLEGRHPAELQPVVDNLNQVLDREQSLRKRYRDSLSNLAHSLKTPLTVLRNQASDSAPDKEARSVIAEQVARMDQVVSYQLRRAVSEQQQGSHRQTPIQPAARRMVNTLEKVYREQAPQFELAIPDGLAFPGDEQDLLELLGNLLDNACKYGRGRIRVSAHGDSEHLHLTVEDNGPGIPEDQREQVIRRGQRLDTLQAGQGIGLAVAADIVGSYGGRLTIGKSEMGGAIIKIQFPNHA